MAACRAGLFAFVCCLMACSVSRAAGPALEAGDRVIFFGDSITNQGSLAGGYVTLVRQSLTERQPDLPVEIIGSGVPGNRVADLENRLDADVLAKNPTVVVIYIGINDVLKRTLRANFTRGLRELVTAIQGAGARVVLCTLSVIGERSDGSNPSDPMLDEYAEIARQVARDTNAQLLDLRSQFLAYLKVRNTGNLDKEVLTNDGIHLNATGNRFVADLMLDALGVAPPPGSGPIVPPASGLHHPLETANANTAEARTFLSWVDEAVANPDFPTVGFTAFHAALAYKLTARAEYAQLAITTVDDTVATAVSTAGNNNLPLIASDKYQDVFPAIRSVAFALQWCKPLLSDAQQQAWSRYCRQAVYNIWNPTKATWYDKPFPWTAEALDNPGHHSHCGYLGATVCWALCGGEQVWFDLLTSQRFPALARYMSSLPQGGSREGTGFGSLGHRDLFEIYGIWAASMGDFTALQSKHCVNSILYWTHATTPDGRFMAPIGDQPTFPNAAVTDTNRVLINEALSSNPGVVAARSGRWWTRTNYPQVASGFNTAYDMLNVAGAAAIPALLYRGSGAGHYFVRSDWTPQATFLDFTCGAYSERNGHQNHGAFDFWGSRRWLTVTENTLTFSGAAQTAEYHNMLRFEKGGVAIGQSFGGVGVGQVNDDGTTLRATLNLSPLYAADQGITWTRQLAFARPSTLTVTDDYQVPAGVVPTFQLQLPVQPTPNARGFTAGQLRATVLAPQTLTLTVDDWTKLTTDALGGWRVNIGDPAGSGQFVVQLDILPDPASQSDPQGPPVTTGVLTTKPRKVQQITTNLDKTLKVPTQTQTTARAKVGGTDLGSTFEHKGRLYFLFGDPLDCMGYTASNDPWNLSDFTFPHRTSGKANRITFPGLTDYQALCVPCGGVSYNNVMYVVFTTSKPPSHVTMKRSVMGKSTDDGLTWSTLYDLSVQGAGGVSDMSRTHFINVSMSVVNSSAWPGLPHAGDNLLIFGTGFYRKSLVYLAAMPAGSIDDKSTMRYFTGISNGAPTWSNAEADAVPLFTENPPTIGEFSCQYIPQLTKWVLLYGGNAVLMRTADVPWGPYSAATTIWDAWGNDGYGNFLHVPLKNNFGVPPYDDFGEGNDWGGPYAPYIIPKWTTGTASNCQLFMSLSTHNPYATIILRTNWPPQPELPTSPTPVLLQPGDSKWTMTAGTWFNTFSHNNQTWITTSGPLGESNTGLMWQWLPRDTKNKTLTFQVSGGHAEVMLLEGSQGGPPVSGNWATIYKDLKAGVYGRVVECSWGHEDDAIDANADWDLRSFDSANLKLVIIDHQTTPAGKVKWNYVSVGPLTLTRFQ